ncbi:MAG: TIGR02206 family membrane protein [Phycisphaerae bacterium]|nr:TIGR02206 family membrane protein [Phycisphaerae bacterium]
MTLPETFQPMSVLHAISAAGCALLVGVVIAAGRRAGRRYAEPRIRRAWVAFVIVGQLINMAYYLAPSRFDWAWSLPLQLCDIAGWLAAWALISAHRWPRTALYYFGFGLCTQAFITPTLTEGPFHPRYWLFWITHAQIIGSALYDFIVRGYRPTWRDYGVVSIVFVAYGALVTPLNITFGWNYGYIGPSVPGKPTLIQSLGPWPLRMLWVWLIAQGAFALLTMIGGCFAPIRDGTPHSSGGTIPAGRGE